MRWGLRAHRALLGTWRTCTHLQQHRMKHRQGLQNSEKKMPVAQPVPVSVPKGGGHLLGASSRKTAAQSEKSWVTGEEKQHQQNASPHIIGGTHGTFLLRKEHQVTSGPKQKKTPDQPFQSREILPELSPSSRTNETKGIQNMLWKGSTGPNLGEHKHQNKQESWVIRGWLK